MQDIKVTGRNLTFSEDTRARNPHLFGAQPAKATPQKPDAREARGKERRLRQDEIVLNMLEKRWLAELERCAQSGQVIYSQSVRFRLGGGCWYKPDFVVISPGGVTAWEVKGPHAFRGGKENIKVAASLYPSIRWVMVWEDEGKNWVQQTVTP